MAKKMTEGRPLPLIMGFAVPLLIGNVLQQTYNIIDAAIVGRALGANALASVGASSSVQFLVLGFCIGLACGFGVPIAKSFGAGDMAQMRSHIFHSMFLTGVFAVILTAVCALLCPQILHLLSTPDEIYQGAYNYLIILFLGIPFSLLYNLMSSILRSVGDSRTPFIFLAISTVLNIILDLVCILVFHWGCAGAAAATITAQAVSGILCCIYIWTKVPVLRISGKDCLVQSRGVRIMCTMGVPMGLQYSITAIGSMVMQYANNSLDSVVYVSAFTAALRLKQFFMCPFDAIATGVSVFCSQNLGAGKKKRIVKGLFQGMAVAVGYGLCAGILLIFFGRDLCRIFISSRDNKVLDAAAMYLFCQGFFLLESRYPECEPHDDTGTWLFRQSSIFRRDRDGGKDRGQPDLCSDLRLYGNLFRRSDSVGVSVYFYLSDLSDLLEKGRCEFSLPQGGVVYSSLKAKRRKEKAGAA